MKIKKPHLSVVATSRNDNHGGDLLFRMQHFIDATVAQCKRFKIVAELIIVEWNPPEDRPLLENALRFSKDNPYCKIRIIKVSREEHLKLKYSDKLPLFQMIGKNVGIRRAEGEYILATNIDVILSDEVMKFIRSKIRPGYFYRADRFDVNNQLPETDSFNEVLKFCKKNVLTINTRYGSYSLRKEPFFKLNALLSYLKQKSYKKKECVNPKRGRLRSFINWLNLKKKKRGPVCFQKSLVKKFANYLKRSFSYNPFRFAKNLIVNLYIKLVSAGIFIPVKFKIGFRFRGFKINTTIFSGFSLKKIHSRIWVYKIARGLFLHSFKKAGVPNTNACGDFTLMAARDWMQLRGYPEWEIFSWHIDSIFLYQALQHGIEEVDLGKCVYHIDHEGGFIVNRPGTLFQNLHARGLGYIDDARFKEIVSDLKKSKTKRLFNEASWGLGDLNLEETVILGDKILDPIVVFNEALS